MLNIWQCDAVKTQNFLYNNKNINNQEHFQLIYY